MKRCECHLRWDALLTLSRGRVTTAPVLRRVIVCLFPRQALSPQVYAACDVRTRVNIRLKRRYVAVWILAVELGSSKTIPDVLARVARLESVLGVNVLNRDSRMFRLVLDATLQPSTGPRRRRFIYFP
ncbi:MAG: hypothetical protein J07HQX50_02589 [Haloquadratum sp. J07HQX50]|nr:MAG: hypothetical protein J07HQX50_02589 [Haloquadratum sp. J07HQX50]